MYQIIKFPIVFYHDDYDDRPKCEFTIKTANELLRLHVQGSIRHDRYRILNEVKMAVLNDEQHVWLCQWSFEDNYNSWIQLSLDDVFHAQL